MELEIYRDNLEKMVAERTAELEKSAAALFESEELFRLSFENASVGKSLTRPDGTLARVNKALCDFLGYSREELTNINFSDITHPGDIAESWEYARRLIAGEIGAFRTEKRYIRKDGQIVWGEASSVVLKGPDGKPQYLITNVMDITSRKMVEEKYLYQKKITDSVNRLLIEAIRCDDEESLAKACLTIAEEMTCSRFGYIVEINPQGKLDTIAISNPGWDACTMPVNEAVVKIRNMEVRGLNGLGIIKREPVIINDPQTHPARTGPPPGHPEITSFMGIPLFHSDELIGLIGLANNPEGYDIEDQEAVAGLAIPFVEVLMRKRIEDALKKSEENYRTIFDSANDAIFLHDPKDGSILDVNDKMCEMYSYTRDEAVRINIEALSEGNPPHSQAEAGEKVRKAHEEGPQLFEWKARDKSGRIFWVEVNLKLAIIGGRELIMAIVRDISERKQAEDDRLNLERQLQHAQKMESLGILAGGIAHDFNNILMAIMGNAELGLMKISDVSPARTYFESINLASARAANLCKQMLAYSGKGRFVIQLIDLSEVVEEMGHMLKVAVTKKAIIQYDLAEGMPAIEADITQIQQIIMNLIMNASEAIGDKSGSIYLKTCMVDCDMRYLKEARFTNDLDAGRYVCLEVSDTGSGMDKETLSRIFDPFFTTKFIGRGLGLSAVLGIVTGHKGAIKVYSELGKGTTFRLLFPAVKREVSAGPEDFVQYSERLTGRGIVLLVDDEDAIRSIGRSILEGMGYNVLLAANGKEAIEIFKANLGNIACVILDLTMPAMDGEETFREMRINSEEIPIIMSSGYNQQEVVNRFIGKNLSGFIQKPYSIKSLKEVLRKVLGGR